MTATRRHGDELEQAIRDAVTAELEERGYAGTSYESVAARAGTSKTVLYRRWPAKAEMVMAALFDRHQGAFAAPAGESLEKDITAAMHAVRGIFSVTGRETMLMLMAELDETSGETLRTLLFSRGSEVLAPALARARERGELGPEEIPARLLSLPFDLVRNELAMSGSISDAVIDEIVDDVVIPLLLVRSGRERLKPVEHP